MPKTPAITVKPDYPNVINKRANHLGCFLSEEAVNAARRCGVLKSCFPAGFNSSDKYHCKLFPDQIGIPLFIVELTNGTDENVFRNMAVALYHLPA